MYSPIGSTGWYHNHCGPPAQMHPAGWFVMPQNSPLPNSIYPTVPFADPGVRPNYGSQYTSVYGNSINFPGSQTYRANVIDEFNPRYIEDLRTERTYLLNLLRVENEKATELLSRIPFLEWGVVDNTVPPLRRKMRKQLGWVRHRLRETTQQEQAIMIRLGQLMGEIQWAENCRAHSETECHHYQQLYDAAVHSMQSFQLNPTTPIFQAEGYYFPVTSGTLPNNTNNLGIRTNGQDTLQLTAHRGVASYLRTSTLEGNEEKLMEYGIACEPTRTACARPELSQRSSSLSIVGSLFDTGQERQYAEGQRRYSLPILPGVSQIWAPIENIKLEDVATEGDDCRSHISGTIA
jgi:hypothetical protein